MSTGIYIPVLMWSISYDKSLSEYNSYGIVHNIEKYATLYGSCIAKLVWWNSDNDELWVGYLITISFDRIKKHYRDKWTKRWVVGCHLFERKVVHAFNQSQ